MSIHFHVGQKVVCIRGSEDGLTEGEVYVIERVGLGLSGAEMVDVVGGPCFSRHVPAWFSERFRPAVERKTDISVFTAMLTKTRISVPE